MVSHNDDQKHFKVVYGKVLGIPVGSATPTTDEGRKILAKYFVPPFILIGISVFGTKLIEAPGLRVLIFLLGWFSAALAGFLFCRQLKRTGEFEREYFFKKPNKDNSKP